MNVYFLVEGRRCERKLYPAWLSAIAPHLQKVKSPRDASSNCYYLISGEGYPSILDVRLPAAICDIEETGRFDLLVVVVDSDEETVEAREKAVIAAAERSATRLTRAKLKVVVQHRCIETWLLGNRRIFVRNPEGQELRSYVGHYDTRQLDPELMPKLAGFVNHAQFHYQYLKAIFQERKTSYTKSHPGDAATRVYLEQLIGRIKDHPNHLASFSGFLGLCDELLR